MADTPMSRDEIRALHDKVDRAAKLARTYARRSEDLLYAWRHHAPRQPMPTVYWTLVEQLLDTAHAILERLPDSMFETTTERSFMDGQPFPFNHAEFIVGERIENLGKLYERRVAGAAKTRLIVALENTTGRTDEEAQAFRTKAAELRAREARRADA